MSQVTVLYDACVLYPAPLRSFLMYLAMEEVYLARWTNDIHEEWIRNVQKDYSGFTRQHGEKIRDLMNAHVADGLLTGYESLIPNLSLPDPDDRHVLAAAIHARANYIVTFNLKDFPENSLEPFGIVARHPDEFVIDLLLHYPNAVCRAARQQRQGLKKPPLSAEEYLASLARQGLTQTVEILKGYSEFI